MASLNTTLDPTAMPIFSENQSSPFYIGFTQSFIIVFLSELFDRTFLMVMLLTGKINNVALFLLAAIATNIMNVISVSIGALMPMLINEKILKTVLIVMFLYFGYKMCRKSLKSQK